MADHDKLMDLKKSKKGFTLVEIIVVPVTIAILAAIPTMLDFVDQARASGAISEGRATYTAAQLIVTEKSAKGVITDATTSLPVERDEIVKYTGDAFKVNGGTKIDVKIADGSILILPNFDGLNESIPKKLNRSSKNGQ